MLGGRAQGLVEDRLSIGAMSCEADQLLGGLEDCSGRNCEISVAEG